MSGQGEELKPIPSPALPDVTVQLEGDGDLRLFYETVLFVKWNSP
jgi:hypothetical protein